MDPSSDQALLQLFNTQRKTDLDYHAEFFKQIAGFYDSYRGFYAGRVAPSRNNLAIPLLYSIVWADTAKKVQACYGGDQIVQFQGMGPDDDSVADKNSALVSSQLRDCDSVRKAVDFFASADIYGTAIMRLGWTHIERIRRFRTQVLNHIIPDQQTVVEFDGPDWDVVDILDFVPQAGKKEIRDMTRCWHRYYVDYDDLLDMNTGPNPAFTLEALHRLKESPVSADSEKTMFERWGYYRSFNEWQAKRAQDFAKPVEVVERWGLVPREFAPDGCRMRVITVANGKVVLRNDPLPFENGQLPFIKYCPNPDPHYFHGIGKVQIGTPLQAASARLLNQKLDAHDLFLSPMFVGDATKVQNTQNLNTRPGRLFLVDGNPAEAIQPLPVNLQGMAPAMQELGNLWRYMQLGTGMAEDTVMGMDSGGSDRQTAFEFRGRQEQAMTRLGLEALLASVAIENKAEWFRDANRQYLPVPKLLRIMGDSGLTDKITGLPLPPEAKVIEAHELNHDFHCRAVGPMRMMTKISMRQDAMQLMQMMGSNPALAQGVNWINFAKEVFSFFDGFDPKKLLVQQVPAINAMAQGAGMTPEDLSQIAMNPAMAMNQAGGAQQVPEAVGA